MQSMSKNIIISKLASRITEDVIIKVLASKMIYPINNCPTPSLTPHEIYVVTNNQDTKNIIDNMISNKDLVDNHYVQEDDVLKVYYFNDIDQLELKYNNRLKKYENLSNPRWPVNDPTGVICNIL